MYELEPLGNYKYQIETSDFVLHGFGVGDSGDWPEVAARFQIQFSRNNPNNKSELTWDSSNWYWTVTNGTFGYKFIAAIAIDPPDKYHPRDLPSSDPNNDLWYVVEKDFDYPSDNWWNRAYKAGTSAMPAPGPHVVTSTKNTAKLCWYVRERDCMHDNNTAYCFDDGNEWYLVDELDLTVPTYEEFYNVTYDANGGTPEPSPKVQSKSNLQPLPITSTIPSLAVNVTYYRLGGSVWQSVNPNRVFNGWLCDKDSRIYNYSDSYSLNQDCTMTAQWGNASFVPPNLADEFLTLTYNYNNGSTATSTNLARVKSGYSTSSGGTATYFPGTSYTTTDDVKLYSIYGGATVVYNNLPQPTKTGYAFKGWFKDAQCTDKITTDYVIYSNTQIYAGWLPLPVHKRLSNNTWDNSDRAYIWNGSSWVKTPVYKCEDGHTWTNKSQ